MNKPVKVPEKAQIVATTEVDGHTEYIIRVDGGSKEE